MEGNYVGVAWFIAAISWAVSVFVVWITVREIKKGSNTIKVLETRVKKELHDRKSSEVRLGKIGENMAPFFQGWPYDPNNFRFLGNPIDGIQFNEDEVVFVEIKTGKARLTTSQKTVKQLVKEGKVRFATFRVGEDGCELKIED